MDLCVVFVNISFIKGGFKSGKFPIIHSNLGDEISAALEELHAEAKGVQYQFGLPVRILAPCTTNLVCESVCVCECEYVSVYECVSVRECGSVRVWECVGVFGSCRKNTKTCISLTILRN